MTRPRLALALAAAAMIGAVSAQPLALGSIRVYRHSLAPIAARAGMACRFEPSCSHYAEVVIARDGLVKGGWRALGRIARCRPGTPRGTVDLP